MSRKSEQASGAAAGGGKRQKPELPAECCPECKEPVRERRMGILHWLVPDGAEAAPCGCAYCAGCLLAAILARLPYTFKCSNPRCGQRVKTWLRCKAVPAREAANKDPSLRVGVPGDIAGGRGKGTWIMPSAVLEYFTASREHQLSGSALCLAYSRGDREEVQVGAWRLRTDVQRPALTVKENAAQNDLVDLVGVQLHHAFVARDSGAARSVASAGVLGINDLDASVGAETTTQRLVRVLGTGEVESTGEESDQHRIRCQRSTTCYC
jgi:hypothetical protein